MMLKRSTWLLKSPGARTQLLKDARQRPTLIGLLTSYKFSELRNKSKFC